MQTVVLGPPPAELQDLIERRRRLGIDTHDEVWEGSYHMAPAAEFAHGLLDDEVAVVLRPLAQAVGLVGSGPFNLGETGDFRVPDRGLHRGRPSGAWLPTAAVVIEILSPDDETFAKFAFYARHDVDEVLVVDRVTRAVRCWKRASPEGYDQAGASGLLGVPASELSAAITWPDITGPADPGATTPRAG